MTDARVTQAAVEEWAQPNARAQLTQVAIEEWGSVSVVVGTRTALMTQIALEQWAQLPSTAVAARNNAVTINTG